MKISEFKKIGNTNRYKIFSGSEFLGTILDETIVQNHLNTKTEYEYEQLINIIMQGQDKLCFDTALTYISKFTKSEKDLRLYLKQKGFTDNSVDFAINKLKNYNYLDDNNYAKNYISIKKHSKGKKAIFYELKAKGIDENIIRQNLEELESQEQIVEKVALKYINNKPQDEKLKERLFRHLVAKGFEFDEVKRVIDKVLKPTDYD